MREMSADQPLVFPSVCYLCDTAPQREAGVRVIDTGRDFANQFDELGRKYVCHPCVVGLLQALVPEMKAGVA